MLVISRQYRGPPDSANGGYVCGLLAKHVDGTARVRLHAPPPLEQPLSIRQQDAARADLRDGEQVIAEAFVDTLEDGIPEPIGFEAAVHASQHYRWSSNHPFPGCFVCGPDRHRGDGLCIYPGRVRDQQIVAAPWLPDPAFCDTTGRVRLEIVWAALDCPSWFGLLEYESGTTLGLLGQLSGEVFHRPSAHEPCVVIGWAAGRRGRKLFAGSAIYTSEAVLVARSTAIWIEPALTP